MESILIAQLLVTGYLTGLIMVVQLDVYPMLGRIRPDDFHEVHAFHMRRITYAVGLPMLFELIISIALVAGPIDDVLRPWAIMGLVLTVIIWASTVFIQVPLHRKLEDHHEPDTIRALTRGNWVRTACWMLRSVIAALMVYWL